MTGSAARTGEVLSFGHFSLAVNERLLTKRGVRVELGARALDTLIALVSRANEVVSKRVLLTEVWPDTNVDEGSLRFHVVSLRKALGDGQSGARYIETVAGRGYCFVAPVLRSSGRDDIHTDCTSCFPQSNLPARTTRMVGRSEDIGMASARLAAGRFVTIVGSGGVGKTTVAVSVGYDLLEAFAGAVVFIDLGAVGDPALAAATVAAMLGLSVQSDDATPGLVAYLRDRRILLILDTCEHLVDAVAVLATRIVLAAPQAHVLATSREALRTEGEQIFRLGPLACPPDEPGLTAASIRTFPAAQLFLERAEAGGARLDLSGADVAVVASICRTLDGVPLAIELAAGRVEAYGLHETARLLGERLALLWPGRRTAPPRQRTLLATLDWSYGLLSESERAVLRRLAVFAGHFTLEAALEVVPDTAVEREFVFASVDSLVAKSIVAVRPTGAMVRYRLLDTTRAYALQIRLNGAEAEDLARRHAAYYRRWLEQAGSRWPSLSGATERALHLAGLGNVRAALEWCFRDGGNAATGVGLATAAAPIFLSMSLLPECQRWSERAISALGDAGRGSLDEMRLQAAVGVSSMFTRGGVQAAREALGRSLSIAEEGGGALHEVQTLAPLAMFHLRTAGYNVALRLARRCSAIAGTLQDPGAVALAHSVLGISLHLSGDLSGAHRELEATLVHAPRDRRTTTIHLGVEGTSLASGVLARNLWLQGWQNQAEVRACKTVLDAERMDHPLTLAIALIWATTVYLWIGDLRSADQLADRIISCAEANGLAPYLSVAHGFKGEIAVRRGDARGGVDGLLACLRELHAAPYEMHTTGFNIALAQGFTAIGQAAEAVESLDQTILQVERNEDFCYLPELLRVKGGLLLSAQQGCEDVAEACFVRSLEVSRQQGSLAWELRATTDLAAMLSSQGRSDSARALLLSIVERFVEGRNTTGLKAAESLLATLSNEVAQRFSKHGGKNPPTRLKTHFG